MGNALVAFFVLALLFPLRHQAEPQTADEVIERHLAAQGGGEALGNIASRVSIGTVTMASAAGPLTGSVESYAKTPNKSRLVMRLDLSAKGLGEMTIDQRFDGTNGVVINSMQGSTDIVGDQLEDMRNGVFPSTLLQFREQGLKAELLRREKVDGKDLLVLAVTPRRGPTVRMFVDLKSHLLLRTVAKVPRQKAR